MAVTLL